MLLSYKADHSFVQFNDGREIALLHYVYSRPDLADIRNNPTAVCEAIDAYGRKHKYMMNVGEDKGRIVTDLIAKHKPSVMVELGGYVGYSAVLFGAALRAAGGKTYYSLEMNPEFAAVVLSMVNLAGLSDVVKVVVGRGAESLVRLHAELGVQHIDLLFIDHIKRAYTTDLKICEHVGLIKQGSVIAADNVIKPGNPPYLKYVRSTVAEKKQLKASDSANDDEDIAEIPEKYRYLYDEYQGPNAEVYGQGNKGDTTIVGNPQLVYESKLYESYEPTGEPDGVEVTVCTGVE